MGAQHRRGERETGTSSQQRFTYNQGIERGNASLDRRLAYVTSVVWELPFGRGKSWLNEGAGAWILGGWQVGGIFNFLGGTPDSHTFNQDTTNVGGANRGNVIGDLNLPKSQRTIDRWFNTDDGSARAAPARSTTRAAI